KFSLEHWKAFCNSYKTIIEKTGFEEACKGVFVDEKDFPVNVLELVQAPASGSFLVSSDPVPVAPADPAPADSGQKKKRKKRKARIDPSPDLIKKIADDAAQNPGLTNGKLAKLYNLSDTPFRRGKPLREAVDFARTGDLNRHAAKPDKPFNDEN
ncbi:MAG: hypothetical protein ACI4UF_04105, partial [Thermoguttaceae bacterium]